MTEINKELRKKLNELPQLHQEFLVPLITDLINSESGFEQKNAEDRFKNSIKKYFNERSEDK